MTDLFSSGSEESLSDDSQETGHREPEKGESPNPNRPTMTFGELLKLAKEMGVGSSEYDESDTSESQTPTPTDSSDPSTTAWEVLTIPKKRRGTTRKDSSRHDSSEPQQQAKE